MIQEYYKNYAKNAYNFITDTNWLRLRFYFFVLRFQGSVEETKYNQGLTATNYRTNLFVWTNYKVWTRNMRFRFRYRWFRLCRY